MIHQFLWTFNTFICSLKPCGNTTRLFDRVYGQNVRFLSILWVPAAEFTVSSSFNVTWIFPIDVNSRRQLWHFLSRMCLQCKPAVRLFALGCHGKITSITKSGFWVVSQLSHKSARFYLCALHNASTSNTSDSYCYCEKRTEQSSCCFWVKRFFPTPPIPVIAVSCQTCLAGKMRQFQNCRTRVRILWPSRNAPTSFTEILPTNEANWNGYNNPGCWCRSDSIQTVGGHQPLWVRLGNSACLS